MKIMKKKSLVKRIYGKLDRMGFLNWMSDELYLKIAYYNAFSYKLDLNNPLTFNEKLQWLKLHDRKPEYTDMVDKYLAKKYVANVIGKDHIIPTLGVWNSFDEIDFDKLPTRFVLKCTHDSGGLVVCKDKSKIDKKAARKKIEKSMRTNYYESGREWPYKNVMPQIIAEEYMEDASGNGLNDYKFYCFDGEPKYLYVSNGMDNHETARLSFLTMNWEKAPFGRSDYREFEVLPPKPKMFDEMVKIAKSLSSGHPFLRVDLYEINGQVYFSELTFSPCSGFMPFVPREWDEKLGELVNIEKVKKSVSPQRKN